jgi:GNAT superfamily N-acetyltransferase
VRHEALVAIDEATGQIVGVGRYATGTDGGVEAGMALAVTDAWQRRGIGHGLAERLIARARANGIARLTGSTLVDNVRARSLLARLGFRVSAVSGDVLDVELEVEPAQPRRYRGVRRTSGSSSRELRASLANTRVR